MSFEEWLKTESGQHCTKGLLAIMPRINSHQFGEAIKLLDLAYTAGQIDQAQQDRGELKKMFGDGEDAAKELSEQKLSGPLGIEEFAKALKSGQEAKRYIGRPFEAGGGKG